eukprot:gene12304-13573_t
MSSHHIEYPKVRRDETCFLDFHGNKIADPYVWLEDPDSEETKKFVKEQNELTLPYLDGCELKEKLYNSALFVQNEKDAPAEVFLDPNELAKDGSISIKGYDFTEDGEFLAYQLSKNGSDWCHMKFMKVATKEDLPDVLENVKFSCISWTGDGKGVFYNRYPKSDSKQDGTETETNLHQKLYYHVLGTNQSEDILCLECPEEPRWHIGAEVTLDGKYVLITVRNGCDPVNKLFYVDLDAINHKIEGILPYTKIVDNFDAEYEYISNDGTIFTFKTNKDSPRYKVINIDFSKPEMENWTTLIEQQEKDVLEWAKCVNENVLAVCYTHDVKHKLYLHNLSDGKRIRELSLDVGRIQGFSGHRKQTEIFYKFTSFLTPGTIYHLDLSNDKAEPKIFRDIKVTGFDASNFQTDQIFVPSKDGTLTPVFIVHRKGVTLDGTMPCLLYGYGGFNISIAPMFRVSSVVFMQHLGGVFAVANIRGGGEYGEEWHRAGTHERKQNVFHDFQAAAEYLIANKYTSPNKLTIEGGSNGGLLVAACANQRPELYKCVVAQVGVMDMLKFHKFTIGHAWITDYGCADEEKDFQYLIKYSPLHNIRKPVQPDVQYPAMLLFTADHDDRVVPLHSFKFIAELQHVVGRLDNQTNPLFIRIDTKAGHGGGKPTAMVMDEIADKYSFIAKNTTASWQD